MDAELLERTLAERGEQDGDRERPAASWAKMFGETAYTRSMASLIAKIRNWLGIGKKR